MCRRVLSATMNAMHSLLHPQIAQARTEALRAGAQASRLTALRAPRIHRGPTAPARRRLRPRFVG
jgi:hypothetical protein